MLTPNVGFSKQPSNGVAAQAFVLKTFEARQAGPENAALASEISRCSLIPDIFRWEMDKRSQPPGKTTAESRLNAVELYEMKQRPFLLPAGEGQNEGEREAMPDLVDPQNGFENTP